MFNYSFRYTRHGAFEVIHINNKNGDCGLIVLSAHILRFCRSCLFVLYIFYDILQEALLFAPYCLFLVLRLPVYGRRNCTLFSQCVYNLFSKGGIQAPRCQHNYKGIADLEPVKVSRFFHTFFAIPGLRVLLATVTGESFSLPL